MTDYYPLIARAVSGLDKNSGEARRGLYERARNALVAQLRGLDPPLTESEITRERLALEEAIRKVEAESARRQPRTDTPGRPGEQAGPGVEAPRPAIAAKAEPVGEAPRALARAVSARRDGRAAPAIAEARHLDEPEPSEPPPAPARSSARTRFNERSHLSDEGLKGFRDVVAEAETLGEATAQAGKTARQAYAAVPSGTPELDRIEPRIEPEGLRPSPRETAWPAELARAAEPVPAEPARAPDSRSVEPRSQKPPAMPTRHVAVLKETEDKQPRSMMGLVAAILAALLIVGLAGVVYWQRVPLKTFFTTMRGGQPSQLERSAVPTQPKITDRVGQPSPSNNQGPVAPVAQRVVLYEEDPTDAQGKRYLGSVIWRTEMVSPAGAQSPEVAVRADLEIPERRITMTMSIRRNTDQALPASHTVEIVFNLPADFPFGGISNVPGILMKQAEQTRGAPLAGLAVKVTSGFFLVGLSAVDSEMQRNLDLLRERSWFDIPIVYNNGRRAILAIEKGTPGERAFADAFATWTK
jgi:hypothetical protein